MDEAEAANPTLPGLSVRGEWTVLLEHLLNGIVHASNNRFTALMSLAQLAEMESGSTEDAALMRQELARLHEVVSWVAALVAMDSQPEALELHSVVETAIAMHALHPRMRSIACTLDRGVDIPPVRTRRGSVLRLVLLLIEAAKREAEIRSEKAVRLQLSADDATVRLTLASSAPLSADSGAFAATCDATLVARDGQWILELPTLAAVRERERAEATRTPAADA